MIMCIVCGSLERLTKLCAYSFQFWFQVLPLTRGRARDDFMALTTAFSLGCLDSDILTRVLILYFLYDVLRYVTYDFIIMMFDELRFS